MWSPWFHFGLYLKDFILLIINVISTVISLWLFTLFESLILDFLNPSPSSEKCFLGNSSNLTGCRILVVIKHVMFYYLLNSVQELRRLLAGQRIITCHLALFLPWKGSDCTCLVKGIILFSWNMLIVTSCAVLEGNCCLFMSKPWNCNLEVEGARNCIPKADPKFKGMYFDVLFFTDAVQMINLLNIILHL